MNDYGDANYRLAQTRITELLQARGSSSRGRRTGLPSGRRPERRPGLGPFAEGLAN